MALLNVGQPFGGIVQISYTVADIETAMVEHLENFKLGPWFVRGPFSPSQALYRGQPA